MANVTKGSFLILSRGEYAGREESAPYLVLNDFDVQEEMKNYIREKDPTDLHLDSDSEGEFVDYLKEKNLLTYEHETTFTYVHLGNYKMGDQIK